MKLPEIVQRDKQPKPWAEGENIPWHDPDFSRRILKEHLSQKHDAASRRTSILKKHVDWIHNILLENKPSRILDLGCGPGLYTARLATLGHACHGIDFGPASIAYAVKRAPDGCTYTLGDIRTTDFGSGYDLVMLIFGEFNVFKPEDARRILRRAFAALNPGGKILLEPTTFDAVYELGNQPATWYSAEDELFADEPHLCLMESFWDEESSVAIERYFIVDVTSDEVKHFSSSTQAYENDELLEMLAQAEFHNPKFYPSLTGKADEMTQLQILVAQKENSK